MSLYCWRKVEYPEKTDTGTGRTCKLHTQRLRLGFKPSTFLLWGVSAIHCTAAHILLLWSVCSVLFYLVSLYLYYFPICISISICNIIMYYHYSFIYPASLHSYLFTVTSLCLRWIWASALLGPRFATLRVLSEISGFSRSSFSSHLTSFPFLY